MTEWVLVLLFITSNGAAIDHIEGFAKQQDCIAAGNVFKANKTFSFREIDYRCIERPREPR